MANDLALAVHLRTTGMGCEGRSWIWDYANSLHTSASKVGPEDFRMSSTNDGLYVSCTMRTVQEAEAVREIIRVLAYINLSAHRKMVHGDIYWTPPPPPETYAEKVARVFGPFEATAGRDSDRHPEGDETGTGSVGEADRARARKGIARKEDHDPR